MASNTFREFLASLKSSARGTVKEVGELVSGLKSPIASLDEAVHSLPVSKNSLGFIEIGEQTVGRLNRILREGDLVELIRLSGRNIPINSADVRAFETLVAETPERAIREVYNISFNMRREFPQLDIRPNQFDSISSSASKDIGKAERNLFKYFKQGTVVALTVGTIVIGVDALKKATQRRMGCFMFTSLDGKTTSCKVQAYSCQGIGGEMCQQNFNYYNTTLVLIQLASMPDTNELKVKVCAAANVPVTEMSSKLAQIIDRSFNVVTDVIDNNASLRPTLDVCNLKHPDVDGGDVPVCRLCDPSANPTSTTFIDSSLYPDNVTFQCSVNPTILETAADVLKTTGKNILTGISTGFMTILKPILIVAAIIIVVLIVVAVAMQVIKRRREDPPQLLQNASSTVSLVPSLSSSSPSMTSPLMRSSMYDSSAAMDVSNPLSVVDNSA